MDKFFYRVNSGDTVYSVSEKFNISVNTVVRLNRLKSDVEEGDVLLLIKNAESFTVLPFFDSESEFIKSDVKKRIKELYHDTEFYPFEKINF